MWRVIADQWVLLALTVAASAWVVWDLAGSGGRVRRTRRSRS